MVSHYAPNTRTAKLGRRSTAGEIYRRAMQDISSADIAFMNELTRRIFANLSA